MSEELTVPKKAKPKKKAKSPLDLLVKEWRSDPSDLRFVLYLARESGLPYQQIDLKKYEVLVFLLRDYCKKATKPKAKQIKDLIKQTFSKSALQIISSNSSIASTDETRRLIELDIKRAFGDVNDPKSIAAKALADIYSFPTGFYNSAHDPEFLMTKLYEFNGKTLQKKIYWGVGGKEQNGPQYQASNIWRAGLNKSLLFTEKDQNE